MGRVKLVGLDELVFDYDLLIAGVDDDLLDSMLDAEGDIVAPKMKQTTQTMLRGEFYTGALAESVKKGTFGSYKNGRRLDIVFAGVQHNERNAAIAYINEYGKTNQPARPFISTAIERSADQAADAAYKVYDQFLKSLNL